MTTKVKVVNFGPDVIELQTQSGNNTPVPIGTVYPGDVSSSVYLHSSQDLKIVEVKKT